MACGTLHMCFCILKTIIIVENLSLYHFEHPLPHLPLTCIIKSVLKTQAHIQEVMACGTFISAFVFLKLLLSLKNLSLYHFEHPLPHHPLT